MAKKGEARSGTAKATADEMVDRLSALGGVTSKGMFGGYGLFHDGVMFGLVNSAGVAHLRVTDATEAAFVEKGVERHGKMPYYAIPSDVLQGSEELLTWATAASAGAHDAKKR